MRKRIHKISSFAIIISFASCDQEVGIDGIVVEKLTGERIIGVEIKMTSEQGNRNEISSENGYFNTYKSFSCGIANCNNDYKIEFSKAGYNSKVINETFYNSSEAEFVNIDKKDTLIIKLDRI